VECVEIRVPRVFIDLFGLEDEDELERHSRILLALELYTDGRISLGKGAELAGISYDEFYAVLGGRGHMICIGPGILEEADGNYKVIKERLEP